MIASRAWSISRDCCASSAVRSRTRRSRVSLSRRICPSASLRSVTSRFVPIIRTGRPSASKEVVPRLFSQRIDPSGQMIRYSAS